MSRVFLLAILFSVWMSVLSAIDHDVVGDSAAIRTVVMPVPTTHRDSLHSLPARLFPERHHGMPRFLEDNPVPGGSERDGRQPEQELAISTGDDDVGVEGDGDSTESFWENHWRTVADQAQRSIARRRIQTSYSLGYPAPEVRPLPRSQSVPQIAGRSDDNFDEALRDTCYEEALTPRAMARDVVPVGSKCMPTWALRSIACLGVLWGDIGTSPLYAVSSIFECDTTCVRPTDDATLNVFSMIFWMLTIVVIVKYMIVLMQVDYYGEGGIFALLLNIVHSDQIPAEKRRCWSVSGGPPSKRALAVFTAFAVFGATAMIGDGLITPALSVLSAVEGLTSPRLVGAAYVGQVSNAVVPITLVLLLALFAIQPYGSSKLGSVSGPIMMLYFATITALGLYNLTVAPDGWGIFKALSPVYAVRFWTSTPGGAGAFRSFASVILVVTGAEAMIADMGHFGKQPIYVTWLSVVFPSLVIQYAGQLAYLRSHPEDIATVFWSSVPTPVYIPTLIIATISTIMASQAMITGCFSLLSQAVALRLVPRMRTVHTDTNQAGQVYLPSANVGLCIGTLALVAIFQHSTKLAGAYGLAVAVTFNMTNALLLGVITWCYGWPGWLSGLIVLPLIALDVLFLVANVAEKISVGGWLPLVMAVLLSIMMICWQEGRRASTEAFRVAAAARAIFGLPQEQSIGSLLHALKSGAVPRHPGTAVFLTPSAEQLIGDALPATMSLFLRMSRTLPLVAILLTVNMDTTRPFADADSRVELRALGEGVFVATANFGYAEPLSELAMGHIVLDQIMQAIRGYNEDVEHGEVAGHTIRLSLPAITDSNIPAAAAGMDDVWFYVHREAIFPLERRHWIGTKPMVIIYKFLYSTSADAATFFSLPLDKTLQIGEMLKI